MLSHLIVQYMNLFYNIISNCSGNCNKIYYFNYFSLLNLYLSSRRYWYLKCHQIYLITNGVLYANEMVIIFSWNSLAYNSYQ